MKTDRLEEFIKANRSDFDPNEPSPDVWKKISGEIRLYQNRKSRSLFFRVAAAAMLLIAVGAIVFSLNNSESGKEKVSFDPELNELIEAEAYYACQVNRKLTEIRKCYKLYPELEEEVETDLIELETIYDELKNDLKDNISRKTVIEAMIEVSRNRLKLVNDVLEQIKC